MKSKSSTYTGFEFKTDGYPALAIINADLKDVNKSFYPYSVFITIIPDRYNENGHPTDTEYDYLNEVEKKMIDYLEEESTTVHIGHTTVYRAREVIFYTMDKEKVEDYLEHFLTTIEREYSFETDSDSEWSNVQAFYDLI